MLKFCYWYDEQNKDYVRISYNELISISKDVSKRRLFERIKANLFYSKNSLVPLKAIINTDNDNKKGFQKKSLSISSNGPRYRGYSESMAHALYKDVIANLKVVRIKIGNEMITCFIDKTIPEEPVYIDERTYVVDLKMSLLKTEPEQYYERFSGVLNFEIFHTCPVDTRQAEDFARSNNTLFEFRIPNYPTIPNNITLEKYNEIFETLTKKYETECFDGVLFCDSFMNVRTYCVRKENGNLTACILGYWITIKQNKNQAYSFVLDGKWHDAYNGRIFVTEDDALRNAIYIIVDLLSQRFNY